MDGSIKFARLHQCAPQSHTCSLDPPDSTSKITSPSVQPLLHSSRQSVPILYNGPSLPPQKLPLCRGIWIPSNTCFIRPTQVHNPNCISIDSVVFAGLTMWQTDWQTDHTTLSVTNIASTAHSTKNQSQIWSPWMTKQPVNRLGLLFQLRGLHRAENYVEITVFCVKNVFEVSLGLGAVDVLTRTNICHITQQHCQRHPSLADVPSARPYHDWLSWHLTSQST